MDTEGGAGGPAPEAATRMTRLGGSREASVFEQDIHFEKGIDSAVGSGAGLRSCKTNLATGIGLLPALRSCAIGLKGNRVPIIHRLTGTLTAGTQITGCGVPFEVKNHSISMTCGPRNGSLKS